MSPVHRTLLGLLSIAVAAACLYLLLFVRWQQLTISLYLIAGLMASLSFAVIALFRPGSVRDVLRGTERHEYVQSPLLRFVYARGLDVGIKLVVLSGVLLGVLIVVFGEERWWPISVAPAIVFIVGIILQAWRFILVVTASRHGQAAHLKKRTPPPD